MTTLATRVDTELGLEFGLLAKMQHKTKSQLLKELILHYLQKKIWINKENGLTKLSQAMVDKITTIHKSAIGSKIGMLNVLQIQRIDEAVQIWLQLIE